MGHIVVDSFDEIERLRGPRPQRVLLRVTPGIKPSTHSYIQTGQVDSKFGFGLDEVPRAVDACAAAGLELRGLHAHIGSQVFELEAFERLAEVLGAIGDWPLLNLGGGLGIAYTRDGRAAVDRGLRGGAAAPRARGRDGALRAGPLAGGERRGHDLHGGDRQARCPACAPTWRWTAGMSDNLRPMLYGARYEAEIADRFGGERRCAPSPACTASRATCSCATCRSTTRAPGDVLVIPATGAYGHSMANNYNAVPRPPVIFCSDGDARVVVRRETYDDLTLRDV